METKVVRITSAIAAVLWALMTALERPQTQTGGNGMNRPPSY